MSAKTMAEVIAGHWSASTHADRQPTIDKCDGCGAVLREWGDGSDMPSQLAAHQAAALTAAGFGPVQAAKAEAWDEAAKEFEYRVANTRSNVSPESGSDFYREMLQHAYGMEIASKALRARAAAERGEG